MSIKMSIKMYCKILTKITLTTLIQKLKIPAKIRNRPRPGLKLQSRRRDRDRFLLVIRWRCRLTVHLAHYIVTRDPPVYQKRGSFFSEKVYIER